MPHDNVRFKPRSELLTFEEIERFVRVVAKMGVSKLRITGGEPLVRAELPKLVSVLSQIPGIEDLAMTTNGMFLTEHAGSLKEAGLDRVNISLDGLSEETFRRIARRDGLDRVLAGIEAAKRADFKRIRLNAVAIRDITEQEIVPLAHFAREQDLELRFIEFMPLDAEQNWQDEHVLSGDEIRARLEDAVAPLVPAARSDPTQPAKEFRFADGAGQIGFINSVSEPFCDLCNRLRITAEGQLRNCLFSTVEWDARAAMRGGGSDDRLAQLTRDCVAAKKPGHGTDTYQFTRPERAMYQIGG